MRDLLTVWLRRMDGLRKTHPTIWHLRTAPALVFAATGSLLTISAAILIPVDDYRMPSVEPFFFTTLMSGAAVALWWIKNLFRPPFPIQTGTSQSEPLLSACGAHVLLFLLPAFLFGSILTYRIISTRALAESILWEKLLGSHYSMRFSESALAFSALQAELSGIKDIDSYFFRDPSEPPSEEFKKLQAQIRERAIPDLEAQVTSPNFIFFVPSSTEEGDEDGYYRGRSVQAPPHEFKDFVDSNGTKALLRVIEAWNWCATANFLLRYRIAETPKPTEDELFAYIRRAATQRDPRPISPDASQKVQALYKAFISDIHLKSLTSESGRPFNLFPTYSSIRLDNPTSSSGKATLVCSTASTEPEKGFLIKEAEIDPSSTPAFVAALTSFDRIVTDLVRRHSASAKNLDPSTRLMKVMPVTESERELASARAARFRREARLVHEASTYFRNLAYVSNGGVDALHLTPTKNIFPFADEWWWFGSWFSSCGFLFVGISISLIVLSVRAASPGQQSGATWIAGIIAPFLLAIALMRTDYREMIISVIACGGVVCLVAASIKDHVEHLHKVLCLASVVLLPFIVAATTIWLLQQCSFLKFNVGCTLVGHELGDARFNYIVASVVTLLAAGELGLLVWRRISLKPG